MAYYGFAVRITELRSQAPYRLMYYMRAARVLVAMLIGLELLLGLLTKPTSRMKPHPALHEVPYWAAVEVDTVIQQRAIRLMWDAGLDFYPTTKENALVYVKWGDCVDPGHLAETRKCGDITLCSGQEVDGVVLAHEFGHTLGWNHLGAGKGIMSPEPYGVTWSAGDKLEMQFPSDLSWRFDAYGCSGMRSALVLMPYPGWH